MEHSTETYKYDAFISYRHSKEDSYVAGRVHKFLENYKAPASLEKICGKRKVNRIFRDREELPITYDLNDYILGALKDSEYLIVICSPRLKESAWCTKEIESFIKFHGKKNVMLVLTEGEPEDSFPPIMLEDGLDPLAADVRGNNKREIKKKIREESLRILAPMLNVDYDDLRRRNKERQFKKAALFFTVCTTVLLAFSVFVSLTAMKISRQSEVIKENQALALADKSQSFLKSDSRFKALETAQTALTTYEGVSMPYTSKARYALTDALRVYDSARYSKALLEIRAKDTIVSMDCNKAPFEVVMLDYSGYVAVWDYNSYSKVFESFDGVVGSDNEKAAGFIDKDNFYYIDSEGRIVIHNLPENEDCFILDDNVFTGAYISPDGKTIAGISTCGIFFYGVSDGNLSYFSTVSAENSDTYEYSPHLVFENSTDNVLFSISQKDVKDVYVYADYISGEIISTFEYPYGVPENGLIDGGIAYILSHRPEDNVSGSKFCMVDLSEQSVISGMDINGIGREILSVKNNQMFIEADHNAYLINASTGELINSYSFDAGIGCVDETDNQLFIRTLNGECGGISLDGGEYSSYGKLIDCSSLKRLESIKVNNYYYAYVGLPEKVNNDELIFYNYKDNSYATEYDGEVLKPQYILLTGNDAIEIAGKWNTETEDAVSCVLASKEIGYSVISYKNGKVGIYDLKEKKITDEMDIGVCLNEYLGYDCYGSAYFSSGNYAVCVDKNMQITAGIEDMEGISENRENIIMDTFDNNRMAARLAFKIYSLDELLSMADEVQDFYSASSEE